MSFHYHGMTFHSRRRVCPRPQPRRNHYEYSSHDHRWRARRADTCARSPRSRYCSDSLRNGSLGGRASTGRHARYPRIQRAARTQGSGALDEFLGLIHAEAEAQRVGDKDGNVLLDEPDKGNGGRPKYTAETSRDSVRLTPCRHGPLGSQAHCGVFARRRATPADLRDGPTVPTDLLVGAEGAWSRVRTLLPRRGRRMPAHPSSRRTCSTARFVTRQARKRLAVAR